MQLLFEYCSGSDTPVRDAAAAISKKIGRAYSRASIKEAVKRLFPGVHHSSITTGNQRNGKDTRSPMYLFGLL